MYLSDVDLKKAIADGQLIVNPNPDPVKDIGSSSIDLHLDSVEQAMVWNVELLAKDNKDRGEPERELNIARMQYGAMSRKYLTPPPLEKNADEKDRVFRRDRSVVLRPGGFLLWQTKEVVGTPEKNPQFICFIDGKSTRARTGLVVHLTAPTIHAGWNGNITLEMSNFGPIDLVLHEGDAVAQIVVAKITSCPSMNVAERESATYGQKCVSGANPSQT